MSKNHIQLWQMNALHMQQIGYKTLDEDEYLECLMHLTECSQCRERWVFDEATQSYKDRIIMEIEIIKLGLVTMAMLQKEEKIILRKILDDPLGGMIRTVRNIKETTLSNELKRVLIRTFQGIDFMKRHEVLPKDVLNQV